MLNAYFYYNCKNINIVFLYGCIIFLRGNVLIEREYYEKRHNFFVNNRHWIMKDYGEKWKLYCCTLFVLNVQIQKRVDMKQNTYLGLPDETTFDRIR